MIISTIFSTFLLKKKSTNSKNTLVTLGSVSFPLNRPVCAFYVHPGSNGKLAVVGSGAMFSDQYIDKEDNHKIKDVIFEFLTEGKKVTLMPWDRSPQKSPWPDAKKVLDPKV